MAVVTALQLPGTAHALECLGTFGSGRLGRSVSFRRIVPRREALLDTAESALYCAPRCLALLPVDATTSHRYQYVLSRESELFRTRASDSAGCRLSRDDDDDDTATRGLH